MKRLITNKFFKSSAYLIIAVLVLSSCSAIFNGSKDMVSINSDPGGAKVIIDGANQGVTPMSVSLKRGKNHVIEIKMEGYDYYKLTTDNTITGWFWGNLICGGILGLVIDLATGSAYDVDPDIISVTLSKKSAMIEQYRMEDFGAINLYDESGRKLASLKINWE